MRRELMHREKSDQGRFSHFNEANPFLFSHYLFIIVIANIY